MVHYMTMRNAQKTPEQAVITADVSTELAAMQRIAMALGDLRDERTRLRVMRWAMERFLVTGVSDATAPAPQPDVSVPASDAMLEVGDLHDFFVNDTVDADDDSCTEPAADEPIESMLKSFVTDFQQIAAACLLA